MNQEFDKYKLYKASVQSTENDVVFLRDTYRQLKGKKAESLAEDFCGTFSMCCDWVKLGDNHNAVGIDLDAEPIAYGKENYLSKLTPEQQAKIKIMEADVTKPGLPTADIIVATNFSYYLFKKRNELLAYFKSVHDRMGDDSMFLMDCFGGEQCYSPNEEETEHEGYRYFWDQDTYEPVTNEAQFYIHFQLDGEAKRERVFKYDWRVWTMPELIEILQDAGFSKTHVYWEQNDSDGEGNGEFKRVERANEDCESWIAYLVSEK